MTGWMFQGRFVDPIDDYIALPNKPCDLCHQNILEAIVYSEVACFLRCERFKRWFASKDEKDL